MNLIQVSVGGKWHSPHPTDRWKTACGYRQGLTSVLKDSDLVDSRDRCADEKCVAGRASQVQAR